MLHAHSGIRTRKSANAARVVQPTSRTAHLLLVVDESPESQRAVEYTAKVVGRRRGFRLHLLHFLPPMPPELLEFGGAEDPRKEKELEAELRRDQKRWIMSAQKGAQPSLDQATRVLRDAGIPAVNITRECSYPTEPQDTSRAILKYARAKRCHTVVLGHRAHSWFRELAGADLTENILRQARGISVWVVQ